MDEIVPLCEDCDIIGITLMTNFFDGAVQVTEKIKDKLEKPIIWGGVHPTIRPEESLKYADIICVGDGEEAVCELLDRMQGQEPCEDIKNLWFKEGGRVIKNPLRPLMRNLDIYPMPDYSIDDHYLMFEDKIQLMTNNLLEIALVRTPSPIARYLSTCGYQTMTGRGCPHKCSYCINDTLKSLCGGKNYLRWRSTKCVIDELIWVKKEMPYVGHIWFSDDSFFARSQRDIEKFCVQYKEKINLPFFALGSPMTLTEDKMDTLVDAGLTCIQMGIQTGSKRMQDLYNRRLMTNEKMLGATGIINRYKDKMLPPHYDFLLDSPFETEQDKIASLGLIAQIPKPFILQTFSLVLYPGTQLYEIAKQMRLIDDEREEIYNKSFANRQRGYLNMLFCLCRFGRFPGWVLRILISDPIVWILNSKILRPVFKCLDIFLKYAWMLYRSMKLWFWSHVRKV